MARSLCSSGDSGRLQEEPIDISDDGPELWSTMLQALTSRGIQLPAAKRMLYGGNKPSTCSSKARIWKHWCAWRKEKGEPAVPAGQIDIVPIINFLGSRRTAGGNYISWGYMRMFIATIKRTLAVMGKLRQDVHDDATFEQFKKSMQADRPDRAKYDSFFDLDDLLAHISSAFEEEPWHNATAEPPSLGRLRALTVTNLKVNGLYRSGDLLHLSRGSLLKETQDNNGSRWGPLEAEGPRGPYPTHVYVHLTNTKTGPREDKLDAYPLEPALCPVYALWHYCRLIRKIARAEEVDTDCVFITNNRQITTARGKFHRTISSADTIANDTLRIMSEAGIDTETFQSHALRGAVASKHLEKDADELDVMARGGWSSNSVFRTFYARTRHKRITLERLRSVQGKDSDNPAAEAHEQTRVGDAVPDVEPTGSDAGPAKDKAGHRAAKGRRSSGAKASERSDPEEQAQVLSPSPQSAPAKGSTDTAAGGRKYKLGLHERDAHGQTLEVPGASERDGSMRYCFTCWAADHNTFIWCKVCNKHMHRRHFQDPEGAESGFILNGWTCDECDR